jgi:hypothetical protein
VVFQWDSTKAATNLRKHKVDFHEAATVLKYVLSMKKLNRKIKDDLRPEYDFVKSQAAVRRVRRLPSHPRWRPPCLLQGTAAVITVHRVADRRQAYR